MERKQLIEQIFSKKSFLCVGLDTDLNKIPKFLLNEEDSIFSFNKAIIDATAPYCVAYKPNLAFYECYGLKGMEAFEKTITYLKEKYPNHFIIADAKRGDIGNTSKMYAQTFFKEVLSKAQEWGTTENLMFVVGATQGSLFADIRKLASDSFLLVPGVGAQGGSLQEVCKYGMNKDCGLLVNSSRGIIYASSEANFAEIAGEKAKELQQEMEKELDKLKE